MVCVQCGAPIVGRSKNAQLCEKCRLENKKRSNREALERSKSYKKPRQEPGAGLTLAEFNRLQRERGLTYGGKPLGSAFPREPKFMEGVPTRWTRPGLDSESR